jgi:hypothetical protein
LLCHQIARCHYVYARGGGGRCLSDEWYLCIPTSRKANSPRIIPLSIQDHQRQLEIRSSHPACPGSENSRIVVQVSPGHPTWCQETARWEYARSSLRSTLIVLDAAGKCGNLPRHQTAINTVGCLPFGVKRTFDQRANIRSLVFPSFRLTSFVDVHLVSSVHWHSLTLLSHNFAV